MIKNKPKISANKLGEYIEATPRRRKKILQNQKYPQNFIVTRYTAAYKVIVDYFVTGKGDKEQIESKIGELLLKNVKSSFQHQDKLLSIEALAIFKKSTYPNIVKFNVANVAGDLNKLSINGVEVSVRPDIIIKGTLAGRKFIGAIKLHFSKTNPLKEASGKYVSTLISNYLEDNYDEKVKPDFCITIDVFTGMYFKAPRAFKSLRKEIEEACNEIRTLWPTL